MNKKLEVRIIQLINSVLAEHGINEIKEYKLSDNLKDDLGLDSLIMVDIVVSIDEEFGVDIFESGAIRTLEELIEVVQKGK
jgi:acyl carrier protein